LSERQKIHPITIIIVILFIVAGVTIIVLDWKEMRNVIGQANWLLLLPALFFTAVSYLCLSVSFSVSFRAFGVNLQNKELMQIGFVSNVVTYLFNVGGMTGITLQFILIKMREISSKDILAPSIFQLLFESLALVILLPFGLVSIMLSQQTSSHATVGLGIATGILTVFIISGCFLVFVSPARTWFLKLLTRIVHFFSHRNVQAGLNDFDNAMSRGTAVIASRPSVLIILIALTLFDWVSALTALWFCFFALGKVVGTSTLITGFSLGITAGFISFIPGGLGVQEVSMAGIYSLLGVPLSTAILASILFRIVYYFVPFLVSLQFYHRLLRNKPDINHTVT